MSDIFLSYSSRDCEKAKLLATLLEGRGWSVWWDRRIPTGMDYADVIESQLAEARCAIVLWSSTSVASGWVKTEAAEANDRGRLAPVLIERVKIPFEFRRIQTADLTDWDGEPTHEEFSKLVGDLTALLGEPPARKVVAPAPLRDAAGHENEPSATADDSKGRSFLAGLAEASGDGRTPGAEAASDTRPAGLLKRVATKVMAEVYRPLLRGKDSQAVENLFARCIGLKNAAYGAKTEEAAAALERESLRRLALDARAYFLRTHLTLAEPLWPSPPVAQNPSAVFFSGRRGGKAETLLNAVCLRRGLELLNGGGQYDYAQSRWNQLRECHVAVFDLLDYRRDSTDGRAAARAFSACYEMGIAFALGRPVVILARAGGDSPFDSDINPVLIWDNESDAGRLSEVLDEAIYVQEPGDTDGSLKATLAYARRTFLSHPNLLLEVRLDFIDGEQASDGVEVRSVLETALGTASVEKLQLINPSWPGDYPNPSEPSCLHVMSENDERWEDVSTTAERACAGKVAYMTMLGTMRSVWKDICRTTHVLVDLTYYNSNVALRLGMAHTLGRNVLLVTRDEEPIDIPSLAGQRVQVYSLEGRDSVLAFIEVVGRFVKG